ncbi:hypothetical protein PoB_000863700 [Plakobranchus ocellatus]|uniref:Uncharacterized protein n=1 Tax=Plakobranchus ocellatus TaxID=259542 RepID=A0AAV3YIW6_9GAST|nr:hypothetical protein PoB_000863700 [Plakobranchus ocellatus]
MPSEGITFIDDDDNDVGGYGASILCTVCFNIENSVKNEMESKSNLEMKVKKYDREWLLPTATDQGILKQFYARVYFTVCPKELMKAEAFPDHKITLLSAATFQSTINKKRPSDICARRNAKLLGALE